TSCLFILIYSNLHSIQLFKFISCENNFKMANQKNTKKCDVKDETGVFGCTCRHGVPLRFLNLKSMGEKYVKIYAFITYLIIHNDIIMHQEKFLIFFNHLIRYSLTECLLKELADKYPSDTQKFTVLYDIACTFHSHVNRNN